MYKSPMLQMIAITIRKSHFIKSVTINSYQQQNIDYEFSSAVNYFPNVFKESSKNFSLTGKAFQYLTIRTVNDRSGGVLDKRGINMKTSLLDLENCSRSIKKEKTYYRYLIKTLAFQKSYLSYSLFNLSQRLACVL